MTLSDTFRIAFVALRRNTTQTMLAMLGIGIGIAAVITMMEIGDGSAQAIAQSIEKYGANTIVVSAGSRRVAGISQGATSRISLIPDDAEAIRHNCPSVRYVSPVVATGNIQLVFGQNNWAPANITGVDPDYFKIRNWNVSEGRLFSAREVENNARVCLVGQTIVQELFNGHSPLGVELRVGRTSLRVIGVLEKKGSSMWGADEDDILLAPWTTIRMRVTGRSTGKVTAATTSLGTSPGRLYSNDSVVLYPPVDGNVKSDRLWEPKFTFLTQILVAAEETEKIPEAMREISLLLRERHRLDDEIDDDFNVRSNADMLNMMNGSSKLMEILLSAIATISLVVGGVGIMNIMLVSVTRRTHEIGIRMAIGARSKDILKQFLSEALLLCMTGGSVGIVVGHGIALIIENQLRWPVAVSVGTILLAFCVSAGVGIVFGFYPAWKASRLDPIKALHAE